MERTWLSGFGLAVAIALFGAVGNGLFAFSQRKAAGSGSPFLIVSLMVLACLVFSLMSLPFIPRGGLFGQDIRPLWWTLAGGLGLYMTMACFYWLFTLFGTTYYALYSVLAILTTTLFVGQILLREPINRYHLGAIAFAILTVVLFTLGQTRQSS